MKIPKTLHLSGNEDFKNNSDYKKLHLMYITLLKNRK